ncbi:MAG: heme-copper oxidase subunit III [Prochlorococcus sp.]|jgi:cytochrome c oxidase subunit 3|nr:heme-copper oxidase subunit III [Prochlorococcaceae cyanobacterium ETNP2_MAG_10]MDP7327145.1 heme-copper oxidase subunit III [Prochlorococcaceae cyanobacterium ETNP7_MAG_30]|tara:strand:- start:1619 stop:2215 length:597 start_codon:yes stop_codon:yes gene_type:complete
MTITNPEIPLNHTPGHIKHDGHNLTGFIIFLCSESIIFLAFFTGYAVLKLTSPEWLPQGVNGLELKMPLINTIVLVSSSFVAYIAERYLHKSNLWGFRIAWLLTMIMGSYFVYGQYIEWSELAFGLDSGVFGGTFYLLTGFHGLHVITGILLMGLMLVRSFLPGNYEKGEMGVTSVSLFWHFVDVIWIILFILIYIWQ